MNVIDPAFLVSQRAYDIPVNVTHIVTDDTEWGVQYIRKEFLKREGDQKVVEVTKLYEPSRYSPNPTMFFSGVIATCSGLRTPDRVHIFGAICAFGGQYRDGLTADVTHLVTTEGAGQKYLALTTHPELRLSARAVHPRWVDDCVRTRTLLPVESFAPPSTASPSPAEPSVPTTATSQKPENGSLNKPRSQFLAGRTVYLDPRCFAPSTGAPATASALQRYSRLISSCGGQAITNLPPLPSPPPSPPSLPPAGVPHMAVLLNRGDPRTHLESLGCLVGSLDWLRDVIAGERITPPKQKVLHYPKPTNGVPGAGDFVSCYKWLAKIKEISR
ncbi:hypothetical protein HDU93_008653 [Gonapodya sp. JEL0774]|nr:hypothetical protein HDU93_008653 [Gonapodya sp. JEL0774]